MGAWQPAGMNKDELRRARTCISFMSPNGANDPLWNHALCYYAVISGIVLRPSSPLIIVLTIQCLDCLALESCGA
eukprot:6182606-Pleurochrysis_carterae.AAC.2